MIDEASFQILSGKIGETKFPRNHFKSFEGIFCDFLKKKMLGIRFLSGKEEWKIEFHETFAIKGIKANVALLSV